MELRPTGTQLDEKMEVILKMQHKRVLNLFSKTCYYNFAWARGELEEIRDEKSQRIIHDNKQKFWFLPKVNTEKV